MAHAGHDTHDEIVLSKDTTDGTLLAPCWHVDFARSIGGLLFSCFVLVCLLPSLLFRLLCRLALRVVQEGWSKKKIPPGVVLLNPLLLLTLFLITKGIATVAEFPGGTSIRQYYYWWGLRGDV